MTTREDIEEALRRLTDGTLTFRVVEDEFGITAAFRLDGRLYTQGWSKYLEDDPDEGVRELLAKPDWFAL